MWPSAPEGLYSQPLGHTSRLNAPEATSQMQQLRLLPNRGRGPGGGGAWSPTQHEGAALTRDKCGRGLPPACGHRWAPELEKGKPLAPGHPGRQGHAVGSARRVCPVPTGNRAAFQHESIGQRPRRHNENTQEPAEPGPGQTPLASGLARDPALPGCARERSWGLGVPTAGDASITTRLALRTDDADVTLASCSIRSKPARCRGTGGSGGAPTARLGGQTL